MSLLTTKGPLPVTAPLVLNPLMARMAEAAGFRAGYLGGGATGYKKFGVETGDKPEWGPLEKEMLATIDIEKLLAVERATVEK